MSEAADILELLRRDGVIHHAETRCTPLTGGVSSEIYLIEDGPERFVVKRALNKLKVQAEWFADVNRNRHEWQFIAYASRFFPQAVPALRHCSESGGYFTMEHLNGKFRNWKQLLLAGEGTIEQANDAARLIGGIHRRSAGDPEAKRLFNTTANFHQLRVEPYLLATGEKHPSLRELFIHEATRLESTAEALVHGDFSPKNVLLSPDRMVLVDCEVAWYGDPAFDVAFMLNHFFLKALHHTPREVGLKEMAETFWITYQQEPISPNLESRIGRLLLMLLLARVDGKSPVEYLDPPQQQFVRNFVCELLPQGNFSVQHLTKAWFTQI